MAGEHLKNGQLERELPSDTGTGSASKPEERRRPGRPRSEEAAVAVLEAAYTLGAQHGLKGATVQAITDLTGVSKMTIYKWWGSRLHLLIDAYMRAATAALPLSASGRATEAITKHAKLYVRALKGDLGRFQLAVLAECLAETGSSELFVERYLNHRRAKGVEIIAGGQANGTVNSDRPAADLYDQIYGTIFYRFQFGLEGLTDAFVGSLVRSVLSGKPA